MSDYESEEYDTNFKKRQIAWQFGCTVTLVRPGLIVKQGAKVRPSEERAMRLIKEHAPEVPIPNIHGSLYRYKGGVPFYGELSMDFVPGRTLKLAWAELDEGSKSRVCRDIWDLIAKIRTIPRPNNLGSKLYRTIDGSPS